MSMFYIFCTLQVKISGLVEHNMILRSLTKHIKDQNWFAVGLDFVIVVTGILIAFQITNWSESRKNNELEEKYLSRLHEEIVNISVQNRTEDFDISIFENLSEVVQYFSNYNSPSKTLLEPIGKHCRAVSSSHIYGGNISLPPTISEMISTAQILLIKDEILRMQIVKFAQALDEAAQLRQDVQIGRLVLSRKYPEFIALSATDRNQHTCDFPAMAESQSFINDFLDNFYRYSGYTSGVIQRQQTLREQLHKAVDAELGLTHPE
jgi:hypothetical protein